MEQNDITSVREMLELLPTEQLDIMLNKELHTEPANDNAIRMILDILREREKGYPVEMTPELENAWEKYQRDSAKIWEKSSRSRKVRNWVLKVASMAAVLILLIAVIPQQTDAETFWEKLMRWTSEIVEFFGPQDNNHRIVEYEFKTDNPGLQQVYDAAVEMGIDVPVVPSWLLDGSELAELTVRDLPSKKKIHSRFLHDGNEIIFIISIYNEDVSHKYQKDESTIDTFELNGVDHFIIQNYDMVVAVWTVDNVECSLSLNCQEDTLREIIKSIYIMEDN